MLIVCRSRTKKRWPNRYGTYLFDASKLGLCLALHFHKAELRRERNPKPTPVYTWEWDKALGTQKNDVQQPEIDSKLSGPQQILNNFWNLHVNHERLMNSGYQQSLVRTARSNPALKVSLEFPRWYQQNEVVVGITQCSNRLLGYWMVPHFCSWNLIIPSLATLTV